MLLPALMLSIGLTNMAQAQLPKEVQADLLATEIMETMSQKDYSHADKLFEDYEKLGLEIPPPLRVNRALVHYQLGRFSPALKELEQYLSVAERDSKGYNRALAMYSDIKKQEVKNLQDAYGVSDINAKDNQGKTLLDKAIEAGDNEKINRLVTAGADINQEDASGETALSRAINAGDIEKATLLIKAGADAKALLVKWGADKYELKHKNTLLHIAAKQNATKIAMLLIALGVEINAQNKFGWTPLHSANVNRSTQTARLLKAQGAKE